MSTRYINVVPETLSSDGMSDYEEEQPHVIVPQNDFMKSFAPPQTPTFSTRRPKIPNDVEASIEGPINPVNYSGTQINIWGLTPPDLAALVDSTHFGSSKQTALGPMTEDMINVDISMLSGLMARILR